MFRRIVFYDNFTDSLSSTWPMFLLEGLALILFGVAVLVFPEILVVMVATTFIVLGAICLTIAWRTRQLRQRYRRWRDEMWEPVDEAFFTRRGP
jgi:uncharacterized membrane protein HdeD (DUF308 family)